MTSVAKRAAARRALKGFTLIEVLVVIAIIGLLAGIAFTAFGGARSFFAGASAKTRLDDLAQVLETYKLEHGEYPPDACATPSEIRRHILKRWKKALKGGNVDAMVEYVCDEVYKFDANGVAQKPGAALLFWLAGPDQDGFSADEENPFGPGSDADDSRETPAMELAYDADGTNGGNYNDKGLMFQGNPIVYFRAGADGCYHGKDFHVGAGDVAAPYMKNERWINDKSFQLILPGEDGLYGSDPFAEGEAHGAHSHGNAGSGHVHAHDGECDEYAARDLADSTTLSAADRDNVTNFAEGATLESEME
ncbi:MAG: type II secretion system protein [Thermoguttaceae bacterium]|nr:type II secretion system protein [Thermoguttaceae bacterium]